MIDETTAAEADGAPAPEKNADIPVQTGAAEPVKVATEQPDPAEQVAAPAEEGAAPAEEQQPGKKGVPKLPDWAQKKIAESEFEKRESARKLKAAEDELARLKAPAPAKPTSADEAAATAAAPQGGYKSPQEFEAAVQAEAAKREANARAQEAQQKFDAACNTAYTAGKADPEMGESFDAAIANLQQLGFMNRDMLDVVLELDAPAKVLFALGSDPDKAAEIMALPPAKRAVEIARLGLADPAPKPAPVKLSNAPRPITPVEGSARVTAEPSDTDDDDTWFKKRNEQVQKRLRAQAGA